MSHGTLRLRIQECLSYDAVVTSQTRCSLAEFLLRRRVGLDCFLSSGRLAHVRYGEVIHHTTNSVAFRSGISQQDIDGCVSTAIY